ncbi:MAG: outer membrane lipoprotein carrier protein LolA [Syntrophobacterales bacterium]|nr:outer membrane lipoprotein carrier protein LolA [Syntrophobacterales bacterium]
MIRNAYLRVLSFIFLSFLCAGLCLAAEAMDEQRPKDTRSAVFERIAAQAAALETISSDFIQEQHVSMLKESIVSSGRFAYERPDRIYWEVIKPSPSGFAVMGDKARRWEGDLGKSEMFDVQKVPVVRAIVEQVFAWARADFQWLEKRYRIVVTERDQTSLKLFPLSSQEKKFISHLNIVFSGDWSHVAAVDIHDKSGDHILITFSRTSLNEPLHKDLFPR